MGKSKKDLKTHPLFITFIVDMTRKCDILTNLDLELLSLGQEVWLVLGGEAGVDGGGGVEGGVDHGPVLVSQHVLRVHNSWWRKYVQ